MCGIFPAFAAALVRRSAGTGVACVQGGSREPDGRAAADKEIDMGDVYTVVITAILLFPWSLVGVILAGALLGRGRAVGARGMRRVRSGLLPGLQARLHLRLGAAPRPCAEP
jgi:hypothetical protein